MENTQKIDAHLLYAGRAFYVKYIDEKKEDTVFSYENPSKAYDTVHSLLKFLGENNINILNSESFKFFESPIEEIKSMNESLSEEDEALMEFEMFNVTRRDITSFSDFLKKSKDITKVVKSGTDLASRKFQLGYMHEVQRNPLFSHPAFDNLYKSFGEKNKAKREESEGGNYTTPGAFPAGVGGF